VDFTFDQPVYLTGGNRTGFALVPSNGGDSLFGSDFKPSNQTDPQGDNTITVLFNGSLSPSNFARGFVSNDTVSSGPQGNEQTNIGQAEDISPNTTSTNPDLVSVRVDCQQNQAFFRFDEPLDQGDVVQNTGGLQLYFNDTTRASAQAVNKTSNPAVLRASFTDLPQGKTLSDAVGGIVTNGTVAGQSPSGPGGQAINQFDEIAPVQKGAGCGTTGGGPGSGGGSGNGDMTGGMNGGGTGGNGSGGTGNGGMAGGMQPGNGGSNANGQNGGAFGGQSQLVNQSFSAGIRNLISNSLNQSQGIQQSRNVAGDINITISNNATQQSNGASGGANGGANVTQSNETNVSVVQQSGAGF
jgi:hypothetical protein